MAKSKVRVNEVKTDASGLICNYAETQKAFGVAQSQNRNAKAQVVSSGLNVERYVISNGQYYYVGINGVSNGYDYKKLYESLCSELNKSEVGSQIVKLIESAKSSCKKTSVSISVDELSNTEVLEVIEGIKSGFIKKVA